MISYLRISSAFWHTAFRPFFFIGSLYSIILISIWLLILIGKIDFVSQNSALDWHSYEMTFGFLRAILIGFLFTAGQNWTGKIMLRGKSLLGLVLLWFFGRFIFFLRPELALISFISDMLMDTCVIYLLVKYMALTEQRRNHILIFSYCLLTLFHLMAGLAILQIIPVHFNLHFVHLTIFSLLLFLVIVAGRILPFFTASLLPGSIPSAYPWIEKYLNFTILVFIAVELMIHWISELMYLSGLLALSLSLVNMMRLYRWQSWKSFPFPILFVLHLAYFWMATGFLAFAFYRLGFLPASPVYHFFTIGSLSVFIYGMITRVSLGHTGRKITATRATQLAYLILNLAFIIRVIFPLIRLSKEAYIVSAILWILSFLIFIAQFTTVLLFPRIDGKIG